MKRSKKPSTAPTIKIGDKVWWYNSEVIMEVITVNVTHAHVRSQHDSLYWVPLEELKRIGEAESTSPDARSEQKHVHARSK
jgi:hypothetical protein